MPETKEIFIVWTNTDLTEGRGYSIPIEYCETRATAQRLAKKRGVQGSDADVRPFQAIMHNNQWCAPFNLQNATKDDLQTQAKLDERERIARKAIDLGISEAELMLLGVKL